MAWSAHPGAGVGTVDSSPSRAGRPDRRAARAWRPPAAWGKRSVLPPRRGDAFRRSMPHPCRAAGHPAVDLEAREDVPRLLTLLESLVSRGGAARAGAARAGRQPLTALCAVARLLEQYQRDGGLCDEHPMEAVQHAAPSAARADGHRSRLRAGRRHARHRSRAATLPRRPSRRCLVTRPAGWGGARPDRPCCVARPVVDVSARVPDLPWWRSRSALRATPHQHPPGQPARGEAERRPDHAVRQVVAAGVQPRVRDEQRDDPQPEGQPTDVGP